jgi:hypothetical protein
MLRRVFGHKRGEVREQTSMLFTKYCDDQIEENKMGGAWKMRNPRSKFSLENLK